MTSQRTECVIESCAAEAKAHKGMCWSHYKRHLRYGTTEGRYGKQGVTIQVLGGCLLDIGPTDQDGYPYATHEGRSTRAHQKAYTLAYGMLSEGHQVDHHCHNIAMLSDECAPGVCEHRRCVDPAHLVARTLQENLAAAKGRF